MNIAIIGGGAAGMAAAITAARSARSKRGASVVIFEKNPRVGKKLLSTGNGRCNLTNTNSSGKNYHSGGADSLQEPVQAFVSEALARFGVDETIRFFNEMGLLCRETRGGRVFPYCNQAAAVLDILRMELKRLRITVEENTEIVEIVKSCPDFLLKTWDGEELRFEKVIVCAGGSAAPSTGSTGDGAKLLARLGHTIVPLTPALVPLKTEPHGGLNGIRAQAKLFSGAAEYEGEVQFTAYGLTGPAVLDISATALKSGSLALDFMPEYSETQIFEMLTERKADRQSEQAENFLLGVLNKQLGQFIMKTAGVEKLSLPAAEIGERRIHEIASLIKGFPFTVTGHTGFENAQATAGGALTEEFDPRTMESRIVPGLYAAGEVLDVYGDCGGYNLQWAWTSGQIAGACGL